jgi:uncharacterized surface protein with fasciclin (FAS1) repeats
MPGPFTVLAPTDAAFAKLPRATLDKITDDPAIVRDVVFFHITPGKYLASSMRIPPPGRTTVAFRSEAQGW